MPNDLYPLLGQGERLIEPITPGQRSAKKSFPRTYEEARELIKNQLKDLRYEIDNIPQQKRVEQIIFTVRLNHNFLAKSYIPNTFFYQTGMENIGSRRWIYKESNKEKPQLSKLHFVRAEISNLAILEEKLNTQESRLSEAFKQDIQKIEKLSLLSPEEAIQGFNDDWQTGKVEIVLHPLKDSSEEAVRKLKDILLANGVKEKSILIRHYPGGPTFISANITRKALQEIGDFNPLRTVHPLKINFFPELRKIGSFPIIPTPPVGKTISTIKVGIFDGGIDATNPYLANYVKENSLIKTKPHPTYITHGTAVAGVVLYGPLNNYDNNTVLPNPLVCVESFRVLPTSDPADIELYEAIDIVEEVVPARNDINVYNFSFGPSGPILDDEVSRFTYVLDELAWNYRKLFVVAVGNDGNLPAPFNRIQSPSDIVNGLGVGAYTYDQNNNIIRAPYSCVGAGREGCKVKPDLVAFGGDDNRPIHLISAINHQEKLLSMGTSFSAPVIASKAAEILGRCDKFSPLVARALLIHSAVHPSSIDLELGYGVINQTVDEILNCSPNKVTIIYASSLSPASYVKLPIPFPKNINYNGRVKISWSIAVLSNVNPLHVEDYTNSAIEDTFYPHDQKYRFTKKNNPNKIKDIVIDADEIRLLLADGYSKSLLPVSKSVDTLKTEQTRRKELKWDTVVKKWDSLNASSLKNPFLVLHGLGRNGSNDRIDYAVVLTISVPGYKGKLYEDILTEYPVLEPIRIRSINEIMITIS